MNEKITISLLISIVTFMVVLAVMALQGAYAYTHDDLWNAICKVETGGHWQSTDKPGSFGEVGIAQIRKVCVDDVNRILKSKGAKERYTYKARLSIKKSREMFYIYIGNYAKHYGKTQGKVASYEVKARIWNGGPNGWKKQSTVKYWKKVRKELEGK